MKYKQMQREILFAVYDKYRNYRILIDELNTPSAPNISRPWDFIMNEIALFYGKT